MNQLFIVNPSSASGLNYKKFSEAKEYFIKNAGGFKHVLTKNKQDIVDQTRKALHDGVEQIVAIGGDGTIHGVINGFFENKTPINPNATLAISNTGTGSDYYKTLIQDCEQNDWKKIVLDHKICDVDLGYINFPNGINDQFFNNMASIGLSAEIVGKKEGLPSWCPSKLKYILPTLSSLTSYQPKKAKVEIGGKRYSVDLLVMFMCKGLYAGGGMKLGTGVAIDDGQFAVTIVEKISPMKALVNIKALYNNKLTDFSEITKVYGNQISFNSDDLIGLELDGENVGCVGSFKISLVSKAIKVCFPNYALK